VRRLDVALGPFAGVIHLRHSPQVVAAVLFGLLLQGRQLLPEIFEFPASTSGRVALGPRVAPLQIVFFHAHFHLSGM